MSSLNDCIKCIKFHLNIEDSNIIFSDYFKKWINGKYHNLYLAELIQPHCPYCYSSNLKHNGHYTSKRKILSAITEDRLMTSIAREHNVSVNTVQRILESCSSKFYDDFDHLPKHLAFDEFKGVGRQLHFIALDSQSHHVLKILPNRFKKDILKYFKHFPNTQIIFDRFHIVQMLNRSFNSCRIHVMKKYHKGSREYNLLKYYWKLYLKPFDDLEKTKPHYDWHLKDTLTQEQIVTDGLALSEELENTYNLLQDISKALINKNVSDLRKLLNCKDTIGYQMAALKVLTAK